MAVASSDNPGVGSRSRHSYRIDERYLHNVTRSLRCLVIGPRVRSAKSVASWAN